MRFFKRMPSDHGLQECWRCKAIDDDAKRLGVYPSKLQELRARWTSYFWYVALAALFVAMFAAGTALGLSLSAGCSPNRVADWTFGVFLLTWSIVMLISTFVIAWFISGEVAQLRRERMSVLS